MSHTAKIVVKSDGQGRGWLIEHAAKRRLVYLSETIARSSAIELAREMSKRGHAVETTVLASNGAILTVILTDPA